MTHSTQIMKRFAFGMIFAVCLIAAPDAHCQEIRSLTQSPVAEMPQEVRRGWMNSDSITTEVYRVGVGGGVIRGDASGGAYAPVFSSFFAFPLSLSVSGEIAVHRAPFFRVRGGGFLLVSGTWFVDGLIAFSPIGSIPNFRIGLGMSFRFQQFLLGDRSTQLNAHTSAGAALKLEYLYPLTQKLDLGFRLQGGAYLPPWIDDNLSSAPDTGISGGYFSAGLVLQAYW
jgi:hypothetical protein